MRLRDPVAENEEPYNLVPLTDMVFNLLIFFMAATTFTQIERDMAVKLPNTSQARPLSAPPQQFIINIKEDGSLVVNGQARGADEVSQMLADVAKRDPGRNVLIRADERSTFRHFATVADLCRRMGIAEAKIGYMKQAE
jgi:biopolymer transport protein ExbD